MLLGACRMIRVRLGSRDSREMGWRDSPARVEEDEPGRDRQEREKKLAGYGKDQGREDQGRHRRLDDGARGFYDGEGEDAEDQED